MGDRVGARQQVLEEEGRVMLTAESLQGFFDMLESEPLLPEPPMVFVSPTMHRRLYIALGLLRFTAMPKRKRRKVHLRAIARRRQEKRRRLERAYERRYSLPSQESLTPTFEAYLPNAGFAAIFKPTTQLPGTH